VSCPACVLSPRTGGAQDATRHQLAVDAYRDGQLYCMCTKPQDGRGTGGNKTKLKLSNRLVGNLSLVACCSRPLGDRGLLGCNLVYEVAWEVAAGNCSHGRPPGCRERGFSILRPRKSLARTSRGLILKFSSEEVVSPIFSRLVVQCFQCNFHEPKLLVLGFFPILPAKKSLARTSRTSF